MVHNLLGIKIAPDFQRVTLARYMVDTNQLENEVFWLKRKGKREQGKHRGIGLGWQKPGEVVAVCPSACFVVATLLQFQSKKRKKVAL